MTDFAVTGKKRSGKGLFCVGVIRDTLMAGSRVATNMDINLGALFSPWNRFTYVRLPDVPTAEDLEWLGKGYDGDQIKEDQNGVIVLDECSKFFNSRSFGDKSRQPLLDWLIHSGKLRWDVYYQMQGLTQVDKQLRETQFEYHIPVKRTDRWPIPGVTFIGKLFGLDIRFPKMHVGIVRHGVQPDALIVDRRWYLAKTLYAAYDTEQVFLDRDHPKAVGMHSVLSNWHVEGRYLPPQPAKWLCRLYGFIGYDFAARARRIASQRANLSPRSKPKHPLVAKLANLPEAEALRHWRRLDALGAFEREKMPAAVLRHWVRMETGQPQQVRAA